MNTLGQILSNEIINAIGWTLVSITWQGSLVAIGLALFVKLFRAQTAQVKYNVAIGALIVIIAFSIYDFTSSYRTYKVHNNIENQKLLENINFKVAINQLEFKESPIELTKEGFVAIAKQIENYLPYIVNIWALGLLLFMLKFLVGYTYIQRLKRNNISKINEKWKQKFYEIEKKLAIRKKLKYLESGLVKIPIVIGYLKPVIIIPAGMLSGIPENQLEAIIAHKLAHIRRNDYLVNILQTIIEIIFFFHPGVWYISSIIRTERENCCDDIALTVCEGNLTYAKALVSIQELNPGKAYTAVAFSGQKKHLLNRIKRMIMKPEIKSSLSDRIIASVIVTLGVIVASVSLSLKAETTETVNDFDESLNQPDAYQMVTQPIIQKPIVKPKIIVKDTTKTRHFNEKIDIENNTVIKTFIDKDGTKKEMKFKLKKGTIAELYVDGKPVPAKDYPKYQTEVDKTIDELKDAKEGIRKAMREVEQIDFEKIHKEMEAALKNVHIDMDSLHREIARSIDEIKKIDFEKISKEAEINIKHFERINIDSLADEIAINLREMKVLHSEEFQKQMEEIGKLKNEQYRKQMEETLKQIREIDADEIREQILKNQKEITNIIDWEAIQKEIQKTQKEIANLDFGKIQFDAQEKFEKVEKEKMLKEMETELKKLEGLELDKK